MPGVFPEAEEAYNTRGRFGVITDRPSAQDLREVEGRVLGILRRLHRILCAGGCVSVGSAAYTGFLFDVC